MKDSTLFNFLNGYERSEREFKSSKVAKLEKKFTDKAISGFGALHAKKMIQNPLIRFFSASARALSYTSLRAFGALLLSFSLMTLMLNLFSYYMVDSITVIPLISLIASAVCGVVSVPLLPFDKPLIEAIQSSRALDNLLFEVLCMKRTAAKIGDVTPLHPLATTFLGIVIAVIGFLIPMHIVLITIGALILIFLSFASPEFAFMLTLLALPAIQLLPMPTFTLAICITVGMISFLLKVMMGKRTLHFEQYDLFIILLALFFAISGIFNGGLDSFAEAAMLIAMLMAYPLASNLITNRRLADNAINVTLFSSIPTAIYAIIAYFTTTVPPEQIDPVFAGSITSRAASTFGNPNIYAIYLIVTVVFSFVLSRDKERSRSKIYYSFIFLLNLAALIMTWTRGAWIAIILALIGALIVGHVKFKMLLVPIAAIPVLITVFGGDIINRLISIFNLHDTSIGYRLSIWRSSIEMISKRPLLGYGVGTESFKSAFLTFAEDSVSAPHSHNLFIEIAAEAGVFALIIFSLMLIARIRHISTYSPFIRSSSISPIFTASAAAIFAIIVFGMTDYVFYNKAMCFLFFALFGLCGASLRIARQDYVDAHVGLGSESSVYSSQIDINVSR